MLNIVNKKVYFLFFLLLFGCFEDTSQMMVDGKLEPPAPDSAENDKTIGGVDSNNDGVRDDIERWINRRFPGEENYNKRMAWKQQARMIRNVLLETDEEEIPQRMYEWNYAGVCTVYIYSTLNKEGLKGKFRIDDIIHELSTNTRERQKKWLKSDLAMAGRSFTDPSYSDRYKTCHFTVKGSEK